MGFVKKALILLLSVLLVPLLCQVAALLLPNGSTAFAYAVFLGLALYVPLSIWCLIYLRGKTIARRDYLVAIAIGLITITYTIPLHYIGFAAGFCTTLVYLVCRLLLAGTDFAWYTPGLKKNIWILLGITALFFLYFLIVRTGKTFAPSFSNLRAWAPALCEELIYRVLFPVLLFRCLKLRNNTGNRIWVFWVIVIPFAMLHFPEAIAENAWGRVIPALWSPIVISAVCAYLIRKYGFLYGAYTHMLADFIIFSLV